MVETEISDADLIAEFEAMARRAGIEIFDDRREAMLASYRDYRRMTARLHEPMAASVEGSGIFSVDSIKRSQRFDR